MAHDVWGPLVVDAFHHSERPGQRARRILESRVVDGPDAMPLDAYDLEAVEAGLPSMRAVTEVEAALLARSRAAVHAAERRARWMRWTRRLLVAAVVIFAGLLALNRGELTEALEAESDARARERGKAREAREAADKAKAAEAAARRESEVAEQARARMVDATWMRVYTDHRDDPSIAAAALREVGPAGRDRVWLQAVLHTLSHPVAWSWLPADQRESAARREARTENLLGFDDVGRVVWQRAGRFERFDPVTGVLETHAVPGHWKKSVYGEVRAQPTVDHRGRIVALASANVRNRKNRSGDLIRFSLETLDGRTVEDTVECFRREARVLPMPESNRWLFGGVCDGEPWLMDQLGYIRRLGPAAGVDGDIRRETRLIAFDPARPRGLVCNRGEMSREPGSRTLPDRPEWFDRIGERSETRYLVESGGRCEAGYRANVLRWFEAVGRGVVTPGAPWLALPVSERLWWTRLPARGLPSPRARWLPAHDTAPLDLTRDSRRWVAATAARQVAIVDNDHRLAIATLQMRPPTDEARAEPVLALPRGPRFEHHPRTPRYGDLGFDNDSHDLGARLRVDASRRWLAHRHPGTISLWTTPVRSIFERTAPLTGRQGPRRAGFGGLAGSGRSGLPAAAWRNHIVISADSRRVFVRLGEAIVAVDLDDGTERVLPALDLSPKSGLFPDADGSRLLLVGEGGMEILQVDRADAPGLRVPVLRGTHEAGFGLSPNIVVTFGDAGDVQVWWFDRRGAIPLIGHELDVLAAALTLRGPFNRLRHEPSPWAIVLETDRDLPAVTEVAHSPEGEQTDRFYDPRTHEFVGRRTRRHQWQPLTRLLYREHRQMRSDSLETGSSVYPHDVTFGPDWRYSAVVASYEGFTTISMRDVSAPEEELTVGPFPVTRHTARSDPWPDAPWRQFLPGHDVGFSPDGRWLVGVTHDRVVRRWPLTVDAALEVLKDATVGCLPPHIRMPYFGLTRAEAEEAWRQCERERGRQPLPLYSVTAPVGAGGP